MKLLEDNGLSTKLWVTPVGCSGSHEPGSATISRGDLNISLVMF